MAGRYYDPRVQTPIGGAGVYLAETEGTIDKKQFFVIHPDARQEISGRS